MSGFSCMGRLGFMVEFFEGLVVRGSSEGFADWMEKRKDKFSVLDGHILEFRVPRVIYFPFLGVDIWVDRGQGRALGGGFLRGVTFTVNSDWGGTLRLLPFQDDEFGRRRLGEAVSFSNVSGGVSVSRLVPLPFGLDRWGELYMSCGVRLEFSGASSGVLRKVEVSFVVSVPSSVSVVGANFPL